MATVDTRLWLGFAARRSGGLGQVLGFAYIEGLLMFAYSCLVAALMKVEAPQMRSE